TVAPAFALGHHDAEGVYAIHSEPAIVDDVLDALPFQPVGDHFLVPGVAIPGVTDGANPAGCTGTAPASTGCTTGMHLSFFIEQTGFLAADFPHYTGTIESKEVWLTPATGPVVPEGALTFRCDVVDGFFARCGTVATLLAPGPLEFPPPGTVYAHTCASYDLGTTAPGGSGPWRCFVDHR
ncbi:MAG: hypothetical protein LC624_07740, partial [Halobacteriales archaeon]|nr:hypothetical protein [Halobacteriales archaeon]